MDVVTTMSDPSIPLTTGEYSEWGNPEIKEEFEYILRYSPYDNIDKLEYPSILVTAGLWDSQVQYYEPAKYVAKLRDFNQSDNPIIMKVNMSAGHSGNSGRFESLKEVAMEYAFFIEGRFKLKEIEGKDTVLNNSKTLYGHATLFYYIVGQSVYWQTMPIIGREFNFYRD